MNGSIPWLIAPMERRLLRAGGTPYAAPWWTLAAVIARRSLLIPVSDSCATNWPCWR
ncbi:MAG: hypothetical protein IPP90_10540 [Gemmatimonadaceae bacterium]|nr:hypothetical protein [Gemmatimonadaceae bacterium]